jgi:archaellum component FlaC
MLPVLELFEGKSITWILLVALLIVIFYLAKFTRDFVKDTMVKFETQLKEQTDKSEKREDRLHAQLDESIKNTSRIADTLEKIENRFESLETKIECIEKRM